MISSVFGYKFSHIFCSFLSIKKDEKIPKSKKGNEFWTFINVQF